MAEKLELSLLGTVVIIQGRPSELREILTIASVESEGFTVQVVARIQERGERRLLHQLSQELDMYVFKIIV
jgi:hypothetical protein